MTCACQDASVMSSSLQPYGLLPLFSIVVSHFILLFYFCCTTCGILAPLPVNKAHPPRWKHGVLPTGPPGKSLKLKVSVAQSCPTLRPCGLQPARLFCPWGTPGKNTGVGFHFLLQGIFLTQGLNPCLLHCRRILYHYTTREARGSAWS